MVHASFANTCYNNSSAYSVPSALYDILGHILTRRVSEHNKQLWEYWEYYQDDCTEPVILSVIY